MVENIVIGKPIVESWTMFSKDLDDWERLEKRQNVIYRRKIFAKDSSGYWSNYIYQ